MGWAVGYDHNWYRDIGYGVPAYCDHEGCAEEIDRGLAYVCCGSQPYGGDHGCGRYFCSEHQSYDWSESDDALVCTHPEETWDYVSPDHPTWIRHKLTHESWQEWCDQNVEEFHFGVDF